MDRDSTAAFFRRLVGRAAAPASEDPADLGTAFGLEASLGPVGEYYVAEIPPVGENDGSADAPMNWLARRPKRPL